MEAATQAFLIAAAVVAGVLSPVILIGLIFATIGFLNSLASMLIVKAEEIKRNPPFDDVELNLNPATNVLQGRIIKNEVILWQGSVSRQEKDLEQ